MERTIKCTEANAKEFQTLVKNDPELLALVQDLQSQGVFPGLRSMSITVSGDAETMANGLGAWPTKNAPQAVSGEGQGF